MRRLALIPLLLPLSGCAGVPLGYLDSTAPAGAPVAALGWGLIVISGIVCVIVAVLLVVAIWKRRTHRPEAVMPVDDRRPIRWIGFGVVISTVVLIASAAWTLVTVSSIGMPRQPGLTVEVTGQQWWWGVRYDSPDPSRVFTTANQLVIPVGVPVKVVLRSADVIHSFWVPKLGGKMDMIPSRTNVTWIEADKPGDYRGQCTEFCGLQHANMAFGVRAVSQADFDAWWDRQLQPAPTTADLRPFMVNCAACHTIRGTPAGGILGPDLSHFGDRQSIAAGMLPNTPENLARWLENTQTIKPGSKMPELDMLASDVHAIVAYLEDLK
jgi:cytochrome c oxidase subunit 2